MTMPNNGKQFLSATVRTGSNIAFIKYWGVADAAINLPLNNSISMTLAGAHTTTTVRWDPSHTLEMDAITLDGSRPDTASVQRITSNLDRLRALAGVTYRATVISENNFPMASGIASSASGFAALTVAGCQALGLNLDRSRLSAIARRGSGSASRSLFGGFVEWEQGDDDATSVAHQLYPSTHWALYDIVAVVSSEAKHVSSANGHTLAATSPLNNGRIASLDRALQEVRQAIAQRDIHQLGPVIEEDALAMHGVMMTSTPSLFYWQPGTVEVMHAVRAWRAADQLAAYFTIDAGPNVHVICHAEDVDTVATRLKGLNNVQQVIISGPGEAPQEIARE